VRQVELCAYDVSIPQRSDFNRLKQIIYEMAEKVSIPQRSDFNSIRPPELRDEFKFQSLKGLILTVL